MILMISQPNGQKHDLPPVGPETKSFESKGDSTI